MELTDSVKSLLIDAVSASRAVCVGDLWLGPCKNWGGGQRRGARTRVEPGHHPQRHP